MPRPIWLMLKWLELPVSTLFIVGIDEASIPGTESPFDIELDLCDPKFYLSKLAGIDCKTFSSSICLIGDNLTFFLFYIPFHCKLYWILFWAAFTISNWVIWTCFFEITGHFRCLYLSLFFGFQSWSMGMLLSGDSSFWGA